jgi:hypothetical protein
LANKVRDDTAVKGMHAGAVGIENPANPNPQFVHAMIIHEQGFGRSFAFVIASANPDWIDTTTVRFRLRMDLGIAVDFTRGGLEDLGIAPTGHPEQIDRADHARLHRFDRVVLIVAWSCRAGEIVNFINFQKQRMNNVVANQLKVRLVQQMSDVRLLAGEEVVDTDDVMSFGNQPLGQVRAEESGAASDQDSFQGSHSIGLSWVGERGEGSMTQAAGGRAFPERYPSPARGSDQTAYPIHYEITV